MAEFWNNGFCGCFNIKGCGMYPCCCPNSFFCMPCMFASALSQVKGQEENFDYNTDCCCFMMAPCCVIFAATKALTAHYNIDDPMQCVKPFTFPLLTYFQALDTVLVKENLHIIPVNVAPDGGAPEDAEMQR